MPTCENAWSEARERRAPYPQRNIAMKSVRFEAPPPVAKPEATRGPHRPLAVKRHAAYDTRPRSTE
ncbi:hypothetical protein C1878_04780 [Gordonibacter sp. 28C]|nr:hypothetical protein C1878_04780 [Gordonibacter sp. 28C]